ncbi:MAG: hypothetical protein ACFCBW_23515 [Candidatus Competibacterales bacterium]
MNKLKRLAPNLNAFTFRFDRALLDEIKASYAKNVQAILDDSDSQYLFEGGQLVSRPLDRASEDYYVQSYKKNPLLWVSANNPSTYAIYQNFLDNLGIDSDTKQLVDYENRIVMYCGFLVICDRAEGYSWHVDYSPNANAYTLITPLLPLDRDHGNLVYAMGENQAGIYNYQVGEAIMFGDGFLHCTEPFAPNKQKRVLLSMTFGTDKMEYWPILKESIDGQSNFLILPSGHERGSRKGPEQH